MPGIAAAAVACCSMLVSGAAVAVPMDAAHCAHAATHQEAIRVLASDLSPGGLTRDEVRDRLERLDAAWMRAFGATVDRARYQEAVEAYATAARAVVVAAQRTDDAGAIARSSLAAAQDGERAAYVALMQQSRIACSPSP